MYWARMEKPQWPGIHAIELFYTLHGNRLKCLSFSSHSLYRYDIGEVYFIFYQIFEQIYKWIFNQKETKRHRTYNWSCESIWSRVSEVLFAICKFRGNWHRSTHQLLDTWRIRVEYFEVRYIYTYIIYLSYFKLIPSSGLYTTCDNKEYCGDYSPSSKDILIFHHRGEATGNLIGLYVKCQIIVSR